MGIAPQNIKKIFTPYVQANDRVHRFYGGTGLGLSIVKKIIELQSGTLRATSEKERGTVIEFILALPKAATPRAVTTAPSAAELPPFQYIRRVLVGEDDLMSQKVLRQLLSRWKLEPTVVANGEQVVQEIAQHSYDLLIIDYQMPKLNGEEVVKALPKDDTIPIIMLSGETLHTKQLSFGGRPIVFLKKPVDPAVLGEKMATLDRPKSKTTINLDYLRRITGNDPELMVDLINTFIQQVPQEIEKMKTALREKDWAALHLAVHKSKPNFNYVGVQSIQGSLDRFEQDVQQQINKSSFQKQIRNLEEFTKRTIPALEVAKEKLQKAKGRIEKNH